MASGSPVRSFPHPVEEPERRLADVDEGARASSPEETVAIAESAAGGLIAAALLAVPGASAYFVGGAVVYTRDAKVTLLHLDAAAVTDPRPSTEAHALVLARGIRGR